MPSRSQASPFNVDVNEAEQDGVTFFDVTLLAQCSQGERVDGFLAPWVRRRTNYSLIVPRAM